MKRINIIIALVGSIGLLFLIGCKGKSQDSDMMEIKQKIDHSYILLPIEELGQERKVVIKYPDTEIEDTYWIRLANEKIDYWVKIDVKEYMGQELELILENIDKNSLAVKNIQQSDKFEFEYEETYRPAYHFTPQYGWMNDPNGMVYYDGEYHLFFQHNPYGNRWQNMHWGHAVSTDLISWTYLPNRIKPDSLGTIFSGSAIIDEHNTAGFGENALIAIYTNAGKKQTQSIAYSNDRGRSFTKYEGNPVLSNPDIPDFRDPKVMWHKETSQWIMSLATKQTITFYGSPNLKEWTKLSEFGEGIGNHDGVWECPDLFPLTYKDKTKWVLIVSINPGGPNQGSASQYFIGDFDGVTFTADPLPYPLWLDYGRDNYAGVTWSNIPASDGRRIFIGWMSNWDYANDVPTHNFRSAMTTPRELKLSDNGEHMIVASYPIEEIKRLRGGEITVENQNVTENLVAYEMNDNGKRIFEIEMTLKPGDSKEFGFSLSNKDGENIKFIFDLNDKSTKADRRESGLVSFSDKFPSVSISPLTVNKEYKVKLLLDKASSELFVNDGDIVQTNIHFPTAPYNILSLFSKDSELKAENIKIYELN